MKKIRECLKGINPYLVASVAVVILSIGLIGALLWDVPSAENAEISVTPESSMEEIVETQESEVQTEEVWETEEIKEVFAEAQQTQETVFENPEETAEESIPVSEEIREVVEAEEVQETVESIEVFQQPVRGEYFEEELSPREENDTGQDMIPEEEMKELRGEGIILEPEGHEHSWIFDSYYQAPTCSNGGLVNEVCAHCGKTQTTAGSPTGEHQFIVEIAGDCCSAEIVICSECNYREVREKNAVNHVDVEDGFCYGCGQKTS